MPSLIEKYGLERAAASQAEEEGEDWTSLTPAEKEKYYQKVRNPKFGQPQNTPDDNSGLATPSGKKWPWSR